MVQMSRVVIVFSAYDDESVYFHIIQYILIGYIFVKQIEMIVFARVYVELLFTLWFSFQLTYLTCESNWAIAILVVQ